MPTPTYGDRSRADPSLPDEEQAARRSQNRTTPETPPADDKAVSPVEPRRDIPRVP